MGTAYNKIGFHGGPAGNHNGIGEYYKQLDKAQIPFVLKSVDHYGHCLEATTYKNAPHVIVYRQSSAGQPGDYDFDVPDYSLDPKTAAAKHWLAHINRLPPEFNPGRVWLETINEVDKDRADWLGHFSYETGLLAMRDGFKWLAFGWAGGEPEPDHWQTPGILKYLKLCEQHPDRLGVALHEYSYQNTLQAGAGSHIGRFENLFRACDINQISRPVVVITEFGWRNNWVPDPAAAIPEIEWVNKTYYAGNPEIKGAAIWYLGSGDEYAGIEHRTQKLIAPLTAASLSWRFEENGTAPTPPEPVDPPADDHITARVPYERDYILLPPSAGVDWAQAAIVATWEAQRWTVGGSADDAYNGDGLRERNVIAVNAGEWGTDPTLEEWADIHYPGHVTVRVVASDPIDLMGKLQHLAYPDNSPELPPFSFEAWPTEYKVITQPFGANSTYYGQFGLPGHEGVDIRAPHGSKLFAVKSGTVYRVERIEDNGGNYGVQVRIDHGNGFKTVYAHMLDVAVSIGQQVKAGQLIGRADNTGNSSGSHLHLTLKFDGATAAGLTVYPSDIIDPTPYLTPDLPIPDTGTEGTSTPAFGVHTSADSQSMSGDKERLAIIRPEVIKILSGYNPQHLAELVFAHHGVKWIIRAFLDFGGRTISPQQFFEWTANDVERSINILRGYKVPAEDIVIELHNEPNLTTEGLGFSWGNGAEFANWLDIQIPLWRNRFPGVKLIYPGLSPGEDIGGLRQGHKTFLNGSDGVIAKLDGVGVHAYWSKGWPMEGDPNSGIELVKYFVRRFPGKGIWITEASNNTNETAASMKGDEYVTFWQKLKSVANIKAITYFVLSASNPAWGWVGGSGEIINSTMAAQMGSRE